MNKSKSIISWGQLILIFGVACLFLFALIQKSVYIPKNEIEVVDLTGYEFNSGTIISYNGTATELNIPSSYSLGPTENFSGRITFNYEWQAFDFLVENYASGAEGYYEFYKELLTHEYPWTYDYSIDKPTFIEGNDIIVTAIDDNVFNNNENLEKVVIPSSIQRIGSYAFQYCHNLKEIELNEGLTFIGDSTFWGCAIKTINLPDTLETIYPYAFFRCEKLEHITIPKNVKTMLIGTFNACISLKEVTIVSEYEIEASGTEVYNVFSNCTSLETVYVPKKHLNYYQTTYPWSLYSDKYKILN